MEKSQSRDESSQQNVISRTYFGPGGTFRWQVARPSVKPQAGALANLCDKRRVSASKRRVVPGQLGVKFHSKGMRPAFSRGRRLGQWVHAYARAVKDDIRQNRANAAEQLGFLGRVMHGRNPRNWLRDLGAKIGEPVDYSLMSLEP